jgi:hypothetical protein
MSMSRRYSNQVVDTKETGPHFTSHAVKGGKVTHDARGTAVWDWDIATGVLARKSVEELLTSLDAPGVLSLDAEPDQSPGWSGDPYNRTSR